MLSINANHHTLRFGAVITGPGYKLDEIKERNRGAHISTIAVPLNKSNDAITRVALPSYGPKCSAGLLLGKRVEVAILATTAPDIALADRAAYHCRRMDELDYKLGLKGDPRLHKPPANIATRLLLRAARGYHSLRFNLVSNTLLRRAKMGKVTLDFDEPT